MLRFLTAGESHGRGLVALVEGLPAGLPVDVRKIDEQLARRQHGYGRGSRMRIESDRAEVLSGLRHGETLGSPVALLVWNRDWDSWREVMSPELVDEPVAEAPSARLLPVTRPRPGHADLAGMLKYDRTDARDILERASARETAARVAAGSLARQLLAQAGVQVHSHVVSIGSVLSPVSVLAAQAMRTSEPRPLANSEPHPLAPSGIWARAEASPVRCADEAASAEMVRAIDEAKAAGDTLGGIVEVAVTGLVPGLGSHVAWDRRLDGLLAQALMSIPSVKGVEIGAGFAAAGCRGSEVHDAIYRSPGKGLHRQTNRAGGLEGGISTGEVLVARAAFKPIATLYRPLATVDLGTGQPAEASVERSDTCAVPAGGVIAEAVTAFILAQAYLEKFGGDSLAEFLYNLDGYRRRVAER